MNEELLQLIYSKMKTAAPYEQFKNDFVNSPDLQRLGYSKLNTNASFEQFLGDVGLKTNTQNPTQPEKKKETATVSPSVSENGNSSLDSKPSEIPAQDTQTDTLETTPVQEVTQQQDYGTPIELDEARLDYRYDPETDSFVSLSGSSQNLSLTELKIHQAKLKRDRQIYDQEVESINSLSFYDHNNDPEIDRRLKSYMIESGMDPFDEEALRAVKLEYKAKIANLQTSEEKAQAYDPLRDPLTNPQNRELISALDTSGQYVNPEYSNIIRSMQTAGVTNEQLSAVDLPEFAKFLKDNGYETKFMRKSFIGQDRMVDEESEVIGLLAMFSHHQREQLQKDMSILSARLQTQQMDPETQNAYYDLYQQKYDQYIDTGKNFQENILPKFEEYTKEVSEKKQRAEDYQKAINASWGDRTASQWGTLWGTTAANSFNKVKDIPYSLATGFISGLGSIEDVINSNNLNPNSPEFNQSERGRILQDLSDYITDYTSKNFSIDTYEQNHFAGKTTIYEDVEGNKFTKRPDGYLYDSENNIVTIDESGLTKLEDSREYDWFALGSLATEQAALMATAFSSGSTMGVPVVYSAVSYKENLDIYREAFPDASPAESLAYATALSGVEGLSHLILPENKLFNSHLSSKLLNALKGLDSKSRSEAARDGFAGLMNVVLKENLEEWIPEVNRMATNIIANSINGAKKLDEEITTETMIDITALTTLVSGIAGVRQQTSQAQASMGLMSYDDAIYRLAQSPQSAHNMLESFKNKEIAESLGQERIEQIKTDLHNTIIDIKKLPKGTTKEQYDRVKPLLQEKEALKEEMKNADDAFKTRYQNQIEELNEKINDAYNQPETTQEEVRPTHDTYVDTDGKIKPVPERTQVKSTEEAQTEAKTPQEAATVEPTPEETTQTTEEKNTEKETQEEQTQPSIEDEVVADLFSNQEETQEQEIHEDHFQRKLAEENSKLQNIIAKHGEESRQAKAQQNKINILQKARQSETPTTVSLDENNRPVYEGKGKGNPAEERAALRQAAKEGLYDNVPETEVELFPGMTEEDVDTEIARTLSEKGENPRQIVEHIQRLQAKAEENRSDTEGSQLEQIWTALRGGVSLRSFHRHGDRNNLPRSAMRTYNISAKNDGTNSMQLDIIAELLGVTENELIDFILKFPTKEAYEQALEIEKDTPEIGGLKARFEEITGMKATPQNMEAFTSPETNQQTDNQTDTQVEIETQPITQPTNQPEQGEVEAFEETVQQREEDLETYQKEVFGETVIQEKEENVQEAKTQSKKTEKVKEPLNKSELQDVGEKIGGARKDLAKSLKKVNDDDLSDKPLSKIFPRPNFNQLVKDGILTKEAATLLSYLYGNLPAKPRLKHRKKAWVGRVRTLIDTMELLLNDENQQSSARTMSESLASYDMVFASYAKTMESLGEITDLKGYSVRESADGRIYITKESLIVADGFKSFDEATQRLKEILNKPTTKRKGTTFGVWSNTVTGEVFIGKKAGRNINKVMSGFKTVEEARQYLKENQTELDEIWDKMKTIADERRSENSPRVGPDYRKGKNVSSKDFKDTFGFRGVEFGNWVNTKERQAHINEAYDALMDLAHALNIDPRALSLNGQLAFAFGARGKGKANAHYEPGKVVINLTKTKGAGSLAHEWWHALDNYFSRMRGKDMDYLTERPRRLIDQEKSRESGEQVMDDSVRVETILAIKGIVEAIEKSGLAKRSNNLDKTRSKPYWGTMVEMTARAFENFIIQKLSENAHSNDYLANLQDLEGWVKAGMETDSFPYPNKEESQSINEAIQHLFDVIQQKETEDGNIALFQKGTNTFKAISKKAFKGLVNRLNRALGGKNKIITSEKEFRNALKKAGLSEAEIQQMVVAWHGSPHKFDKFSTEFMGTGEGAQAFGWGLYFTDLKSIAEEYAKSLSANRLTKGRREYYSEQEFEELLKEFTDDKAIVDWVKSLTKGDFPKVGTMYHLFHKDKQGLTIVDRILDLKNNKKLQSLTDTEFEDLIGLNKKSFNKFSDNFGRNLYKVTLHKGKQPSEYTWLEWDKPVPQETLNKVYDGFIKRDGEAIGLGDPKDGEQLYNTLTNILGSAKAASLFLLENGIDGIKYPAESISRGATSDTARGFNYVVFDENAVTIEEHIQFMQDSSGTIFGAVLPDGTIYINENNLNANTPFHEIVGHLFLNNLKKTNPKAYNEIIEKLKAETDLMDQVRNDPAYAHLTTDEQIADELFARMVGDKGEQLFDQMQSRSLSERIKSLIDKFWQNIKKWIGTEPQFKNIKNWTPEQFKNATIGDIIDNLTKEAITGKQIISEIVTQGNESLQLQKEEALFPESEGKLPEKAKPVPVKVAKEMIGIMKEVAGFTNNSRTIFDAGIDFIKTTEWFENLSPELQAQVDTPTFRNAVGQMIKSLNASTKRINEIKNKIKAEKQSKKEAVKTITDFINSNDLPKKHITETELKRLMRRAAEVATYADMEKAIERFQEVYEKVMINAESREMADREVNPRNRVLLQVEDMLSKGLSFDEILNSFTDKKERKIAEERINIYKASAEAKIKRPKKKSLKDRTLTKVKNWQKEWFSQQGGFLKPFMSIIDTATGRKKLAIRHAKQRIKDLEREMRKSKFKDWETVSLALQGNTDAFNKLPDNLKTMVTEMRMQIDGLTDQLIKIGAVSSEQAITLEKNKGKYITRTYDYFYKGKLRRWFDKVFGSKEAYEDAFDYMAQLTLANINKNPDYDKLSQAEKIEMAQKEAERTIKEYMHSLQEEYKSGISGQGKDLDILLQRKAIPEPIRRLLEEHRDPRTQYLMTVAKMTNLLYQHEMLLKMKEVGLGEVFFEKNDPNRPETHYVQLTADGNNAYSPLNGLYVTPEFKRMFIQSNQVASDLTNIWSQFTGIVKWGKTVGSPVTHSINFWSNFGFLTLNGLYDIRNMRHSFEVMYDAVLRNNNTRNEMIDILVEQNIIGQSTSLREVQSDIGGKMEKAFIRRAKSSGNTVLRGVKLPFDFANKMYQAEDDFFKAYSFFHEANDYAQAFYGKRFNELSIEEKNKIADYAGEVTKNTLANYDRVYKAAQFPRKITGNLVGNFLSFQAESLRTLINSIQYIHKDFKDPRTKSIAIRRLGGVMTYLTLRTSMNVMLANASGMALSGLTSFLLGWGDDEEEKEKRDDFNRLSAPWARTMDKMYKYNGDGTYSYYTLNIDPYQTTFNTLNAYHSGADKAKFLIFNADGSEPGIKAMFINLLDPFIGSEMSLNTLLNALVVEQDSYNRGMHTTTDKTSYFIRQAAPGLINEIIKNTDANPNNNFEIINMFGVKKYQLDPTEVISIKHRDFTKAYNELSNKVYKLENEWVEISADEGMFTLKESINLEDRNKIESYKEKMEDLINTFMMDYEAAVRLGANTDRLLDKSLKDWDIKFEHNQAGKDLRERIWGIDE